MRSSATGTWTRQLPAHTRGFTLLELLIVVTIIGLLAGVAVLSVGVLGADRDMERELQRLSSLTELVREEGLMQGRDYGLMLSRSGYRFYLFDYSQQAWLLPADDRLLRPRTLPEGLELSLDMEGREIVLRPDAGIEFEETPQPQIVLMSSGEVTPFRITLERQFTPGRMTLDVAMDGTTETAEHDFDRR